MNDPRPAMTVRCACGSVELEARGAPILSAVCYCDDCQEGARRIEALPGADRVLDPDGGTSLVLWRKDRFACSKGEELLRADKLRDKSVTNRMVATCCNSALYLGFDRGPHWVSVYRSRLVGEAPPVEMRLCTKFRPGTEALPDDAPSYPSFPFRFIGKLLAARVAMVFGR